MKAGEHRSPVLAGGVDCPANLVFNDLFEIILIPGGCITAAKKSKSPIVLALIQQELAIVAEDNGALGVGVEARLPALSNMGNPHSNMLFPFEYIAFHLRGLGLKKPESAEEGSRMYLIWQ